MSRSNKKHPLLLAPLAGLLVACVGCPSSQTTADAGNYGNGSRYGSGYQQYPRTSGSRTGWNVPAVTPTPSPTRTTSGGPNIPALISGQPRRTNTNPERSLDTTDHPNSAPSTGLFGLPMLQPSGSGANGGRTNIAPQVLTNLPDTPEAANRARFRRPEGTEPAQPNDPLGLGSGSAGSFLGIPRIPTFATSRRDQARAFYTIYIRPLHLSMRADDHYASEGEDMRRQFQAQLAQGEREAPEGYAAFKDLFDARWNGALDITSGIDWIRSNKPVPIQGEPVAWAMSITHEVLDDVFPGAPASPTASADVDPRSTRLVDPMSATDFYNQYLRRAHQDYASTPFWSDMDETNDFAEALATGIRADEVGYEALREQVEEAYGQDALGWFRSTWNNYLRLQTGYGNDDPIVTNGGTRMVNGKSKSEWKKLAEANMKKTSKALSQLF